MAASGSVLVRKRVRLRRPQSERMNGKRHTLTFLLTCALGFAVLGAACKDPLTFDSTIQAASAGDDASADTAPKPPNEDCPAGDDWLPMGGGLPPPVRMFDPPPHPDTECPFYRGAYQNFLIATTPVPGTSDPMLVNYATLDDAFQSAYNKRGLIRNTGDLAGNGSSADPYVNPSGAAGAAMVRKGPATGKAWLGAVRQAGQRNVLIDQDDHTLYYGIHMNQAFVDFIKANKLQTVDGILNVDPNLEFPPGLVEFKTAWKDIDPRDFPDSTGKLGTPNGKVPRPNNVFASDPGDYSNYITTMAWLPWLSQDPSGTIVEDPDHPVQRKVALIAIHCVYTYPGHPEFVWGSIQHVNVNEIDPAPVAFAGAHILGAPDSQPDTQGPMGPALPDPNDPTNSLVTTPPSSHSYLLYKAGTASNATLTAHQEQPGASDLKLKEDSQSFPGQAESVYRVFPGSKSTTLAPDSAVFSLNSNIGVMFTKALAAKAIDPNVDKRQHYRLVAATWMDKPALFGLGPKDPATGQYPGMLLQNDETSPIVVAAKMGDPMPQLSQGTTCGTPQGPNPTSGNDLNATGFTNTVPGCATRADLLAAGPDGGGDPASDFAQSLAGTDSPFSILGGEDRLSSTSMETFTQTGKFHNCFTCHNTQPITINGTPAGLASGVTVLIPKAAKLNVSHLFSEFVLREEEALKRVTPGN
jgi:hypothetical protein